MRQKERQEVMQSRSAVLHEVSAKKEWRMPELNEVDYKETRAAFGTVLGADGDSAYPS